MRATRSVDLGDGRAVQVRELTVAEVRGWLKGLEHPAEADAVDLIGEIVLDGCSLAELSRMCDLSVADMDALSSGELAQVLEAAKALNAPFFRTRQALLGAAARAMSAPAASD